MLKCLMSCCDDSDSFTTCVVYLQEIYDRGFSNMEKSHQKVLMEMRRTHKRELDQLRLEKDQLLAEETKATQAGWYSIPGTGTGAGGVGEGREVHTQVRTGRTAPGEGPTAGRGDQGHSNW